MLGAGQYVQHAVPAWSMGIGLMITSHKQKKCRHCYAVNTTIQCDMCLQGLPLPPDFGHASLRVYFPHRVPDQGIPVLDTILELRTRERACEATYRHCTAPSQHHCCYHGDYGSLSPLGTIKISVRRTVIRDTTVRLHPP